MIQTHPSPIANEQFFVHLGQQLENEGKWPQAIATYRKALNKKPQLWQVHVAIGNILHNQNDYSSAIIEYEKALTIQPDSYETWYNLANSWADLGKDEESIRCHQKALALKPDFYLSLKELGVLYQQQGHICEALCAYEQALKINPNYAEGYGSLASVYARQGKIREAINLYRRALTLNPKQYQIHSNLLFYINFEPSFDAPTIFEEYRRWNQQFAQQLNSFDVHPNNTDPERRLRIGFVSPDFKEHVVACYLEPFLNHFDASQFEIFLYSNVQAPDEVTARFKSYPVQWRDIAALSDEKADQMIRQDVIDILIDLAGHMANNRLLVFARKPAPIQVTQWGYPNTTGLNAMDYRLTDSFMDPQKLTEAFHTEKLIRTSHCAFCYRPLAHSPEISPLPFLKKGYLTFASFNNFAKVSDPTIELWSRILQKEPQAKLAILIQGGQENLETVQQRFVPHGIDSNRIELFSLRGRHAYLQLHNEVDIALDPFPYNGGITTFESLWMGVPVITLEGHTSCGRHGVSIYQNLDMPEFIARNHDQYLQIALALARDTQRLQNLRSSLRQRLQNSPIMNETVYVQDLQNLYRQIWKNWACKQNS